jgi:hypothetical protein
MPVATHVIKVKAEFNTNWDEEILKIAYIANYMQSLLGI